MAANITPIFPIAARIETQRIADTDTTTKKLLFSAGTNGSRINIIGLKSDDTASVILGFYLSKDAGSTFSLLGLFTVSAGYQGTAQAGIPCFDQALGMAIPTGSSLYVAVTVTVTAGKFLDFSVIGSDY